MTYVSQLGEEDLVYDCLLTTKRKSQFVPDMDFFTVLSLISSHLESSRIKLPKLTSSVLMEITCILLRQATYCLKNMMVLSAK